MPPGCPGANSLNRHLPSTGDFVNFAVTTKPPAVLEYLQSETPICRCLVLLPSIIGIYMMAMQLVCLPLFSLTLNNGGSFDLVVRTSPTTSPFKRTSTTHESFSIGRSNCSSSILLRAEHPDRFINIAVIVAIHAMMCFNVRFVFNSTTL